MFEPSIFWLCIAITHCMAKWQRFARWGKMEFTCFSVSKFYFTWLHLTSKFLKWHGIPQYSLAAVGLRDPTCCAPLGALVSWQRCHAVVVEVFSLLTKLVELYLLTKILLYCLWFIYCIQYFLRVINHKDLACIYKERINLPNVEICVRPIWRNRRGQLSWSRSWCFYLNTESVLFRFPLYFLEFCREFVLIIPLDWRCVHLLCCPE